MFLRQRSNFKQREVKDMGSFKRLLENPAGRSLARKRKSVGLTQHQLAAAAGLSVAKIAFVETGRASLEPDELHRIRKVLKKQAQRAMDSL
jgi:predicted transcriptional regulator